MSLSPYYILYCLTIRIGLKVFLSVYSFDWPISLFSFRYLCINITTLLFLGFCLQLVEILITRHVSYVRVRHAACVYTCTCVRAYVCESMCVRVCMLVHT